MDRKVVLALVCALAAGCDRPPAETGSPGATAAASSGGPAWISGTVDERFATVERHLRGLDVAMVETAHRYAELHGYALYQAGKIRTAIANAVERRPKRAASARLIEPPLRAVEAAARGQDAAAFDAASAQLTVACNACHQAEQVEFIRVGPPPVRSSLLVRSPRR